MMSPFYTELITAYIHCSLVGTPKKFWQGCEAPVFDRILLAKENFV